ncbi:MAG: hypothetical protein AAFV72_20615 [Cyanobacteria bacterium J06635_1]
MKSPRQLDEDALKAFESDLKATAQNFLALRDRYFEIRRANKQRQQLQAQVNTAALPEKELKQLQTQIQDLEIKLESQLLSWETVKEPFWQAVRFGGLGLVVGWLLRGWIN